MRRLALVVSAMAVVETLLYSALAPLLPAFKEELGLSKAQSGLLVAMYAIGLCVAAVPGGLLASRVGVKPSALFGLVMLAATSVAFGLIDSYGGLLATRFLQGAAGALCWASGIAWLVDVAPRQRRGEMIGIFAGAGAAGSMLGPVVGGAGALVGRAEAFAGVAVCALLLAVAAARLPRPVGIGKQSLAVLRKAHGSRDLWRGQWLVFLPGLLLGTIGVLAPLRLHRLGWGPVGIAGTYLVAAAVGVLARPFVGRWADRRGRLSAIRMLLLACIAVTLAIPAVGSPWLLSALVVSALISYGVLWGPAMAYLSQAFEDSGVAQVLGFALMNLTAGVGIVVGSAAGGEVAHVAGDVTAYALTAAACLATVAGLARLRPASTRALMS
ncbi:MAG: MFS transporter [Gaiellaceae bacterium]